MENTKELERLRKKINQSAFHRNVALFFSVVFFINWYFEISPCQFANYTLIAFILTGNIITFAFQYVLNAKINQYGKGHKSK